MVSLARPWRIAIRARYRIAIEAEGFLRADLEVEIRPREKAFREVILRRE